MDPKKASPRRKKRKDPRDLKFLSQKRSSQMRMAH